MPRPKLKPWFLGGIAAILVFLAWLAVDRVLAVAAVQNAVDRDWEISFWDESPSGTDIPIALPRSFDDTAQAWFDKRYANTLGYDGTVPPKTRNRAVPYFERFRALFRGPMHDIHIYYPESIDGDALGKALARFPSLRNFTVEETGADRSKEADWKSLCRRLRLMPQLEVVELGGDRLADAAIEGLQGHPRIRSVTIVDGRLTGKCADIFASLPQLKYLHIEGQATESDQWLTPELRAAIIAKLPGVTVELP
jgi:hypothetical protein